MVMSLTLLITHVLSTNTPTKTIVDNKCLSTHSFDGQKKLRLGRNALPENLKADGVVVYVIGCAVFCSAMMGCAVGCVSFGNAILHYAMLIDACAVLRDKSHGHFGHCA